MLFLYPNCLGLFSSCSSNNAPCPQHRKAHWQVVFMWPLVFKDRDILSNFRVEIGNTSTARQQAGPLGKWGHSCHDGPLRLPFPLVTSVSLWDSCSPQSADQALILWFPCVTEGLAATPTLSSMALQHANRSQLAHVVFSIQVAGHRMELADSLDNYSQVSTPCPITAR